MGSHTKNTQTKSVFGFLNALKVVTAANRLINGLFTYILTPPLLRKACYLGARNRDRGQAENAKLAPSATDQSVS